MPRPRAKNLLIRNIPDEVNDVLEWYKLENGLAVNTDAAKQMIAEYRQLQLSLSQLLHRHDRLKQQYDQLKAAIRKSEEAQAIIQQLVNPEGHE